MVAHDDPVFDARIRRQLEALAEAGYEIDVICIRPFDESRRLGIEGVQLRRLPITHTPGGAGGDHKVLRILHYMAQYSAFVILAGGVLTRRQLSRRYDVIQVSNPPDAVIMAAVVPRLLGTPVILDMHEVSPELFLSKFNLDRRSLLYRLVVVWEQIATRLATLVIAVSEPAAGAAISRGLREDKVAVVVNAPDETRFNLAAGRKGRPPDPGRPLLISHGTLVDRYGFDVAIRALPQVRDRYPGAALRFYGSGEAEPELRRLAATLGVADAVEFMGIIPNAEVAAAVAVADIGIVANRMDPFTELVLPTKLLEYVALGIPAVVSRSPAVEAYFSDAEVRFVRPGDEGELADAIVNALDDPDRSTRMATAAARKLEAFDGATMRRRYREVIGSFARPERSIT
jgi:glycosyltransferase involved in cell wall biosynthesis